MLLGSCFATEMGERLCAAKFACDVNPYGVLYNPISIATALHEMMQGCRYEAQDLFLHDGCWHSPMHHGAFSDASQEVVLQEINRRLQAAHEALPRLNTLILTWGTAYVYKTRAEGRVVGNCHKLPENHFDRYRLTVDEVVEAYETLFDLLFALNPSLRVLLTVSPIRHLRDGLHANQLSKSVLLLAADVLQQRYPQQVDYFPTYELLLDELRDYRFFAEDMVHPSGTALSIVWQRFTEACLTTESHEVMTACQEVATALAHKPFRPDSEAYKHFLGQIVLKIERLNKKYPYLDFQNEMELCRIRLNK